MLNIFPHLLTFSVLSPFILRVVLGFIIINLGYLKLKKEKELWQKLFEIIKIEPAKIFVKVLAFVEIIGGLILIMGAYTQLIAIIFTILFFCEMVLEYKESNLEKRNLTFYILMFTISFSLIFLGAGIFAFDLPL
ncbi:MAG: DoxX family membrane protein [bacterium]